MSDSEEDDYLNMTFADSAPAAPLSSLAKRTAAQRSAADRARPKPKQELERERILQMEKGLRTSLHTSSTTTNEADADVESGKKTNKGAALLAKMGYRGGALGRARSPPATDEAGRAQDSRLTEPIRVDMRQEKVGIGHGGADDPGLKRAREALDREEERVKRLKSEMGGYRERNVKEGQEKRFEGQWWGAMRVCWTLKQQEREREGQDGDKIRPREVALEWRAVVYKDLEEERDKEGRRERVKRLDRIEDEKDDEDKVALGESLAELPVLGEDEDAEEDEEMEAFMELDVAERLQRTVMYLRETWWYCFWCKGRYDDKGLDGCPGTTEDDHE